MSGIRFPRPRIWAASTSRLLDDGRRENPGRAMLGDDSQPCRWWHPDMSPYCARCGSGRADLHDGHWGWNSAGALPWNDRERLALGLPVEEQWWHQAAGITSEASS